MAATAAKRKPPAPAFAGFGKDFFGFFEELADNNDRDWFAANKPRYQAAVVEPMIAFIEAIAGPLAKVSPYFVADPRPNGGSMFRIYRDVRFSKDKRPYKEHGACQFRHQAGRDAHAPGFYVHLAPDEVVYGGGIWLPPSDALAQIRGAIDADPKGWQRVVGNKRLNDTFGGIAGHTLKRPPKGYAADHRHIEDLKRKSFFAMKHAKPAVAGSADFVDEVADTFRAAQPLMKFVSGALSVPF